MTNLKWLIILLLFLPFTKYPMNPQPEKMAITYLLNREPPQPPPSTKNPEPSRSTNNSIFSLIDNADIASIIELLRRGNAYHCACGTKLGYRSVRRHVIAHHITPYKCSRCNQTLFIAYPRNTNNGCEKKNGFKHKPVEKHDWRRNLEAFKSQLLEQKSFSAQTT